MKRAIIYGCWVALAMGQEVSPLSPAFSPTAPTENRSPVVSETPKQVTVDRSPEEGAVKAQAVQPDLQHKKSIGEQKIDPAKPHFIGHRFYEKKAGGWGWVKKPEESWKQARWVAIKESPRHYTTPHRGMVSAEADHHHEYRLLGNFAGYDVYDPHRDEMMSVFIIEGYESLGEKAALDRKPGPPDRFRKSRQSRAFTRGAQIFRQHGED